MTGLHTHGGRVDLAAILYPDAPTPWIDLSTGINPHAWRSDPLPPVNLAALPSPASVAALEAAAAAMFGTDPDRVIAVPGSEIGLRLLAGLDLPRPARFVTPGYGTHADVFDDADRLARADIDTLAAGTLLLANPNNPDGLLDAPDRLLTLMRRGLWLVIDEAFVDLLPSFSIVPHLGPSDRAIVFRSFGKTFGLPGIRLGFMIAPPIYVAAIRHRLGSWPISACAVAYGTAAYRDTAWIEATRIASVHRAGRLDAVLARYGLCSVGACPLFRLIESDAAATIFERLADAGILTRTFDYQPRWLRIGLPADDVAFDRLDRALAHG
ncbi:aminotransferase class I/II-fold pyridoxal phosphate-dependent enzyme [Sphingomonas faeni]|uniref:aminotransferase class I/II-fold pyridoxal phosphate-dependent enzyme n=1 Tax=Sphingomonas faeni TaxID=185950 RepID=UPI0020BF4F5F|nr:aminotransferase class I/II-fold pyridoxal phosphate-dependent enzyme [Sphingomonas faeni]MCK8455337.1 aminotransferase class I/II-fold pyridoxal phosphate-dependent enzyme [Sphingomonas faeni]